MVGWWWLIIVGVAVLILVSCVWSLGSTDSQSARLHERQYRELRDWLVANYQGPLPPLLEQHRKERAKEGV